MAAEGPAAWFIEGRLHEGGPIVRVPIGDKPMRVGRQSGLDIVLRHDSVSRVHAELAVRDGRLWLRDCASSNGTFVNRQRITEPVALEPGDVIHFATCEFVVRSAGQPIDPSSSGAQTMTMSGVLPESMSVGLAQLIDLIRGEHVRTVYEPIVEAGSGRIWACEALGRGAVDGFFESPMELFALAGPPGLQGELSRLFRRAAVRQMPSQLPPGGLFLNVHPVEMDDLQLLAASFAQLRRECSDVPLVLELPEALATDERVLGRLRGMLAGLNIGLAYDDFGAGQARLVELARVPPDYLKFDRKLVAGLVEAEPRVREMVQMLVQYAHESGVRCVAEGVESADIAAMARSMGFDLLQGWLYPALGNSAATATSPGAA